MKLGAETNRVSHVYFERILIPLSPSPSWREIKKNREKYYRMAVSYAEKIASRFEKVAWKIVSYRIISVKYNGRKRISDKAIWLLLVFIEVDDVWKLREIGKMLTNAKGSNFFSVVNKAIKQLGQYVF